MVKLLAEAAGVGLVISGLWLVSVPLALVTAGVVVVVACEVRS